MYFFDVSAESLEVGNKGDNFAVGLHLDPFFSQARADGGSLFVEVFFGIPDSYVVVGNTYFLQGVEFIRCAARVELLLFQPGVGGHNGAGRHGRWLVHVQVVPRVGILAALPVQVGASAFAAPQKGVVIHKLARFGVFAVAFGFGAEGPYHLRVAPHAALADVEVTAFYFQGRIGLHSQNGRYVAFHHKRRHQFHQRPNQDHHQRPDQQRYRLALEPAVPVGVSSRGHIRFCQGRGFGGFVGCERAGGHRFEEVIGHQNRADQVDRAANGPHLMHGYQAQRNLQKATVLQGSLGRKLLPHHALREAGDVHRNGVEQNAQRTEPEVYIHQPLRENRRVVHAWNKPVQDGKRQEAVPAQRTHVYVCHNPVGKVGNAVDVFEREQRPFEGSHAVGGQADHHKFQDGIFAHFVPGSAQGQQSINHAAPGGRNEHNRKHNTQRLRPVGQRTVEQMVRPGPDINENQGPEVQNGELVGIHGPVSHLRQKIIHHAQVGCSQEKRHRIVAIPPLHQGVLHPGIKRVAFEETHGNRHRVDDVQHGHRHERSDVKPDSDVEVPLAPFDDRTEHIDPKHHPDQRDGNVNRPFEFGVFFGGRNAEWQRGYG